MASESSLCELPEEAVLRLARELTTTTTTTTTTATGLVRELPEEDASGAVVRICVLGGTAIQGPGTEELVGAIAESLASTLGDKAWFFTEGMPGVQQTFAQRCGDGSRLCNLLPLSQASSYGRGRDFNAGKDIAARKRVFSLLGDVYLVVEGGPGVAGQAQEAFARGARIVPVMLTGGASSGMFHFPPAALKRPSFATKALWELLRNREAPAASVVEAVAALVVAASLNSHVEDASEEEEDEQSEELRTDTEDASSASRPLLGSRGATTGVSSPLLGIPPPPQRSPQDFREVKAPAHRMGQVAALLPPVARAQAGSQRLLVRDEWNMQEILLQWATSRLAGHRSRERHGLPQPLIEEQEFAELCRNYLCFEEEDMPSGDPGDAELGTGGARELRCFFRIADRDGDGRVTADELHYGFAGMYGHRCLHRDALRLLAHSNLHVDRGRVADTAALQKLMEELNEGKPVTSAEVEMVLSEAMLATDQDSGARAGLLRGLGAWYAHITRSDSSWSILLSAGMRWCLPSDKEHHSWVLGHLARLASSLPEVLPLPKRFSQGHPLGEAHSQSVVGGASQACALLLAVLSHLIFLVVLLLPTIFCVLLILLGTGHGSDRCPEDLDGLLVWFGAVGIATIVVNCTNDHVIGVSLVGGMLKAALCIMPWVGVTWLIRLSRDDMVLCGPYVYHTSRWVWTLLAMAEIYIVGILGWSVYSARLHELALRRAARQKESTARDLTAATAP
ncbi:unnamed protein product [Polarella glacialis]|uniref:EF-hand domain-containing protein n=1 Tax=Polarella glacialis TaxID=89957 RepID=A0A813HIN7_POLGL|nr:unnamed protein product [Polarella glacialis]